MATKKAVVKKDKTKVITISADQFLAGVKRFSSVCEFVERQMEPRGYSDAPNPPVELPSRSMTATPSPKPTQSAGVEQMAYELRSLAAEVQKQAESIRLHLTNGGAGNQALDNAQSASAPTMGPIKDALDVTAVYLFSVRRDLETIAQYAIGS